MCNVLAIQNVLFFLLLFIVFDAVYATFFASQFLIDHLEAVELATSKVVEEFAADNVIYLELRTTPRHVEGKMDQEQHISKVTYSQTFIPKLFG